MVSFEVQADQLELIRQLAERQAGHFEAISTFIDVNTVVDGPGVVIMALGGKYNEGRSHAVEGMAGGLRVANAVRDGAEESARAYREADEAVSDALRGIGADADYDLPADTAPGPPPQLGPAGSAVTPYSLEADSGKGPLSALGGLADRVRKGWPGLRLGDDKSWLTYDQETIDLYHGDISRSPFADPMGWMKNQVHDRLDRAHATYQTGLDLSDPDAWAEYKRHQTNERATYEGAFYNQGQAAYNERFGTPGQPPPPTSSWVEGQYTARGMRAYDDVNGLVSNVRGAYSSVQTLHGETETLADLRDTANKPGNTSQTDWADR